MFQVKCTVTERGRIVNLKQVPLIFATISQYIFNM